MPSSSIDVVDLDVDVVAVCAVFGKGWSGTMPGWSGDWEDEDEDEEEEEDTLGGSKTSLTELERVKR